MRILVELSDRLGEMVCDVALLRTIVAGIPECTLEAVYKDHMAGVIEDCYFIRYRNILSKGNVPVFLKTNLRVGTKKWDAYIQSCEDSSLELARLIMSAHLVRGPEHRDKAAAKDGMLIHRLSVLEGLVPGWREKIETEIPLLEGRLDHAMRVVGVSEGDRVLIVAPGSTPGDPPWPREQAREAATRLREGYDRVLVPGRIADRAHCEWLAGEVDGKAICGELPLPYALALFRFARLLVGTDNCMAQASAAFGVPTVAVGGPADGYSRPWKQLMVPGSPAGIDPDAVVKAAEKATR